MGGGKIGPTKLAVSHDFHSMKKKLYQNSAEAVWRGETERQRERGTGEAGKTTKKSYKRDMSINKKMIYDL